MNYFDYNDFAFNSSWQVTMIGYKNVPLVFVDNVYKNPHRVYEYLKSSPIRSCKPGKHQNGKGFYDGQLYVENRWDPCRENLFSRICEIYNIEFPGTPISTYNQFRLVDDYPGQDLFWSPHVDNNLNLLIYLNPDADGKQGTSIYSATEKGNRVLDSDTEHSIPWKDSSWYTEELCIINKFNSLVAFPGQFPHGQTITDNFYKRQTRFTEVAFV